MQAGYCTIDAVMARIILLLALAGIPMGSLAKNTAALSVDGE